MSASSISSGAVERSMGTGGFNSRLHGRWLFGSRVGFVALTTIVVGLNVLALSGIVSSQLTPDVLRELHRQRVSPTLYVAINVAEGALITLTYVALGVLVFLRRSDERMALFCALMLVTFGGVAATPLDDITGGGPMPEPLASIAALRAVVYLLVVVGQVTFVVFFYLFPSGRFVPRWTRWLAPLVLLYWLAVVFLPTPTIIAQGNLLLVFWLIAVIAQIYRYRRVSTAVEREQAKWIVFGFILAFAIVAVPGVITLLLPPNISKTLYAASSSSVLTFAGFLLSLRWLVALLLVPSFIAVAILRTHLWDIDTLINRALVYGSLTVLLAAVYFGSVIGMQHLASALTGAQAGDNPLIVVVSTLLIAALFTPMRRRLQRTIDHRFFRAKYDTSRTLEGFAATLRTQTDLPRLTEHLVSVVDETMRPAHVSLWLRTPSSERESRGSGA